MDTEYLKDGVARVLDVLKAEFGSDGLIRSYYNGDTENIPTSALPAIMVTETVGEITDDNAPAGFDDILETIQITIAMNLLDDLGASTDDQLTQLKLRRIVKGQDPTTGEYLPQTVMRAIRTHITLDNAIVSSFIRTDFKPNIRGESTTMEAYVELKVRRRAKVPTRD